MQGRDGPLCPSPIIGVFLIYYIVLITNYTTFYRHNNSHDVTRRGMPPCDVEHPLQHGEEGEYPPVTSNTHSRCCREGFLPSCDVEHLFRHSQKGTTLLITSNIPPLFIQCNQMH